MAKSQDQRCKGCGLMVRPGYKRCPRCTMPQHVGADGTKKIQGGTAVDRASSRVNLIALGLLLGVVVLVVMARGGDSDSHKPGSAAPEPAATVAPAQPAARSAQVAPAREEPAVGFLGTDAAVDTPAEGRKRDLVSMEKQLAERRLWATVTADPNVPTSITVSSAACPDAVMKDTLEATVPALKTAGFTALRCVDKSGALAFQLEL